MPRMGITDDCMEHGLQITGAPGTFTYSAVRPEALDATKYTLVSLVIDKTGSVVNFADELLECVKMAVGACQKASTAENLLIRIIQFDTEIKEIHGFKPLSMIDVDNDYEAFHPAGMTALFDATFSAVGATLDYGETLGRQDYDVNAIIIVVTDGCDNASTTSPSAIAKKVTNIRHSEEIESITTILVALKESGTSWANEVERALNTFKDEAKLDQYINVGDATSQKLAKLAAFVSKSISSTSQALGSGVTSQPLTF